MRAPAIVRAAALALLLVPFVGVQSLAGEQPPTASPTPRPAPLSGLRPTAIQTAPIPVASAGEWRAAFPKAELVIVEGAGHFPHVEQPAAFERAVEAFLR